MNGTVYNLGYEIDSYSARICDKLFDKVTYIGKASGKNRYGTFYKGKEVFAYSCIHERHDLVYRLKNRLGLNNKKETTNERQTKTS